MKISTTNVRKADGTKLINGYKISLQKTAVEKNGMDENTELCPIFEDGKITLVEVERLFVEMAHETLHDYSILICYLYRKIAPNTYQKILYSFPMNPVIAKMAEKEYRGKALPTYDVKFLDNEHVIIKYGGGIYHDAGKTNAEEEKE